MIRVPTTPGRGACLLLCCLALGPAMAGAAGATDGMARLMRQSRATAEATVYKRRDGAPALTVQETKTAQREKQAVSVEARRRAHITDKDYLLGYVENGWRIVTAPFRFGGHDWLNAALIAGATGALFYADEDLKEFWQEDVRRGATDDAAEVFRWFGEDTTIAAGSLGAYALAETVGGEREKIAALLTLQTFLLTVPVVAAAKYSLGRDRPSETASAFDFDGPDEGGFESSFPSGHASYAFGAATVLTEVYGDWNPWVPWLSYSLATGAALTRINDNQHWASDVFAGGALGYLIAKLVTNYSPLLERYHMTARPLLKDGAAGVSLSRRF